MNTKLKFSLIGVDSPRLRSYIYFIEKNKFKFEKIFLLKKNSIAQNFKFLNNSYFDNTQSTYDNFLKKNKKKIINCNSVSANNDELIKEIKKCNSKYLIFCSNPGDILKKNFFDSNKRIIHVHPGELSKFKGSTPYYYQILEKKSVTFTSFFMKPKLDSGNPIISDTLRLEDISKTDLNFLDEIYDPYQRGLLLIRTLKKIVKNEIVIKKNKSFKSRNDPYFIIHPVIKFISINSKK